jgi:hypothetical protein
VRDLLDCAKHLLVGLEASVGWLRRPAAFLAKAYGNGGPATPAGSALVRFGKFYGVPLNEIECIRCAGADSTRK